MKTLREQIKDIVYHDTDVEKILDVIRQEIADVIPEKKEIELEEPILFQPNPTRNSLGGYGSCPFYCSLCGMSEIDIQDNKMKDGNYSCHCSVWTTSCGGKWIKWNKSEKEIKKLIDVNFPNLYNQAISDIRTALQKKGLL